MITLNNTHKSYGGPQFRRHRRPPAHRRIDDAAPGRERDVLTGWRLAQLRTPPTIIAYDQPRCHRRTVERAGS